ncbi:MAG: hypothetical protein M1823_008524, partial [Watsoniomyces obsoletus]
MFVKSDNIPLIKPFLLNVQSQNKREVNNALNDLLIEEEDYKTLRDSVNNYDFIAAAFADPTAPKDTTASGLKYDIGKARLTNIYFTQQDQITGSDIRARIGEFTANMDE